MINVLSVIALALVTTFVSCEARGEDRDTNRPSAQVQIVVPDKHPRQNHWYQRNPFRHRDQVHFRHEDRDFVGFEFRGWQPYRGYPVHSAYCRNPAGFYPEVQVCVVPWVRVN